MSYETAEDTPRTDAVLNNLLGKTLPSAYATLTHHALQLERELNFIRAHCRVVLHLPDGRYPLEHTMAARKDQFDAIIAEMPRSLPKPDDLQSKL